jgi:hypothetical protein
VDAFGQNLLATDEAVSSTLRYLLKNRNSGEFYRLAAVLIHTDLWDPVGQYVHHQVRVIGIIRFEMNTKVVRTVHALVHHEDTGFNDCAFARL